MRDLLLRRDMAALRWVSGLSIALSGCGGVEPQALPSGGFWETNLHSATITPVVVVLALDDTATPDAAALREAIVASLRPSLDRMRPRYESGEWQPVDWSFVVALPSGGLVGPPEAPGLQLRTSTFDDAATDALVAEIAALVAANEAAVDEPFEPIEAAVSAVRLVTGERAPLDAGETALQAALRLEAPPGTLSIQGDLFVVVAAARDDQGTAAIAGQSFIDPSDRWWIDATAVLPSDDCDTFEATPRIAAWLASQPSFSEASLVGWPCGAERLEIAGILPLAEVGYGPSDWACTSRPVVVHGDGSAECLIHAEWYAPDQQCSSAGRGWIDPIDADGVRRPRLRTDAFGEHRVCEIPALHDEACRSDLQCTGCGDGWCATEVDLGRSCSLGEEPAPIRFVGGAVAGSPARIRVRCALQ